jgi:hypothetical protein
MPATNVIAFRGRRLVMFVVLVTGSSSDMTDEEYLELMRQRYGFAW